jgi:hypothetical protein
VLLILSANLTLENMHYKELNGVKMDGQLKKAYNLSSSDKHNYTITSNIADCARRNPNYKISSAVIFITAYIITALILPGKSLLSF